MLKNLIERIIQNTFIFRKKNILLNKKTRNITKKQITKKVRKNASSYFISGEIYAPTTVENKKGAICVLSFYDKKGSKIRITHLSNFNYSSKTGLYQYIPVGKQKNAFRILFTPPHSCHTIKVKIMSWSPKNVNVFILPGSTIEENNQIINKKAQELIDKFEGDINKSKNINDTYISEKIIFIQKYTNMNFLDVSSFLFNKLKKKAPKIASQIGLIISRKAHDHAVYEETFKLLTKNGRIKEKVEFLNNLSKQKIIDKKSLRYQKAEDELELLTKNFSLPDKGKCLFKPKKKVLYLLHNALPYNSGGYATRTHGLINNITRESNFVVDGVSRPGFPRDHQKYISHKLPYNISKITKVDNVEYITNSQEFKRSHVTQSQYIKFYSQQVQKIALEKSASIIHAASNYPNGLAAIHAARTLGIKSIYEVRGLWEITRESRDPEWGKTEAYQLSASLEAQALQQADVGFAITKALKDLMINRGVHGKEIHIIPNAVDTKKFFPIQKNIDLLNSLKLKDNIIIGYVGSIVEYEGLDDLLKAFHKIINEKSLKAKLLIVGDGSYLEELKSLCQNYHLQEHVIFTGRVPHKDVQQYISIIDIMPFPRKPYLVCEKVSPLKPFESMASGKPVIVSSCEALTEIVTNYDRGLVFQKGSYEDLANKIIELGNNTSLRSNLSDNALKWVRSERDWSVISNKVAEIYEDLYKRI